MSTATNDVHYSFRSATSAKKSQRTASCRNETRKFVSLFAMSRAVASYLIQWRCRFLGINPAEARQRGYPMKDQSALADAAEGLTATPTGCCLKSVSISVRELSRQSSTPPLARFCFWWSSGFWKVVAVLEAGADADGGSGRAWRHCLPQKKQCTRLSEQCQTVPHGLSVSQFAPPLLRANRSWRKANAFPEERLLA